MVLLYVIAGAFIALGGVAYFFYYKLTKTKGILFAARQELARSTAKHEAAAKAAQRAQQECTIMLRQLDVAMTQTGQALGIAGQIKAISEQLGGLIDYITHPIDAPAPISHKPGRHSRKEEMAA